MRYAVDCLPESLRLLSDMIGLHATMKLVEEHGGTTIWPARADGTRAHLDEILGTEKAEALCAHFRDELYVPRALNAMRALVHEAIIAEGDELERKGWSSSETVFFLAKKHGLSDRWIWKLRKRELSSGRVVDTGQGSLF